MLVAWRFGPCRRQECVDDPKRLLDGVHAPADADQLSVVVLARQRGGLGAPGQGAAGTRNLVGRDLFAVAGTTEHDAKAARIADGALRRGDAEGGVVIVGVVAVGAAVDRLVSGLLQVVDDGLLEFESGVVAAEVDAHGGYPTSSPTPCRERACHARDTPCRTGAGRTLVLGSQAGCVQGAGPAFQRRMCCHSRCGLVAAADQSEYALARPNAQRCASRPGIQVRSFRAASRTVSSPDKRRPPRTASRPPQSRGPAGSFASQGHSAAAAASASAAD